jgi:ribosomal protein S18 acetylase RimI-like enzyme
MPSGVNAGGTMALVLPLDDIAAATDPLLMWAADRPGVRLWQAAGATAIACPDLSRRDRIMVHGRPAELAALLRDVLPLVGPSFRPMGDEALLAEVTARLPGLTIAGRFAWMDRTSPIPAPDETAPRWLAEAELPEVAALLDEAFPESYARPGGRGVSRWAGIRDGGSGELLAVAADAWSGTRIGFLAGVATRRSARGRGLAARLCRFATNELLTGRTRVALFADYWNVAAVATYRKLGFDLRPLAAAHQAGG